MLPTGNASERPTRSAPSSDRSFSGNRAQPDVHVRGGIVPPLFQRHGDVEYYGRPIDGTVRPVPRAWFGRPSDGRTIGIAMVDWVAALVRIFSLTEVDS